MTPARRLRVAARLSVSAVVWLCLGGAPAVARAQALCRARADEPGDAAPRVWAAPLDRRVSMQARDVTLRDALDRLAAAAQFSLAYSSDVLPLDRRVCAMFDAVAAGTALERLLSGTAAHPVAGGENRVVLAPSAHEGAASGAPFGSHANVLDRVVITGNAVPAPERALTIALDVVTARPLQQRAAGTLATMLDGAVPGLWIWSQPPGLLLAQYGSLRGASSFGLSYPKMYIDGIEVANPLLVTQLSPDAIERVEVIRGPEGAALYGADALGGVVNVITTHQGTSENGEHVELRSGAGMAQSAFSPHPVFVQDHTIDLRGGSDLRSGNLSLTAGSTGAYLPSAASQLVKGSAGVRFVGVRTVATGTARFYGERAGVPVNPLLAGFTPAGSGWSSPLGGRSANVLPWHEEEPAPGFPNAAAPESERQYTLGGALTFAQSDRWTHSLVVGLDGYRLANVPAAETPAPSVLDSALRAAQGGADRAMLRAGTVARFGSEDNVSSNLSLAVEHSALRSTSAGAALGDDAEPFGDRDAPAITTWQTSTGLVAQSSTAIRDALFVTGGVRVERDDTPGIATQHAVLPMLGAALVHDVVAGLTVKLRGAYGRGIRPARLAAARAPAWRGLASSAQSPALAPESQEGVEAGADVLAGSAFGLHVTRFDQLAFGLIQPVTIGTTGLGVPRAYPRRAVSELQNVGAIANRGWELASSYTRAQLTLTGSLSLVDSRVRRVAASYTGDLRVGDRLLAVPARTASLDAAWSGRHWTTSWTVSRASDWMNYDRVALARAFTGAGESGAPVAGASLREYWSHYTGVTRLRATFSRELRGGLSLDLTGDNLLNRQRGEPDDATIVPGRTAMLALRASF